MSNDITVSLTAATAINSSILKNNLTKNNAVIVSSSVVAPLSSISSSSLLTSCVDGAAGFNADANKTAIATTKDTEKPSKTSSDDCNNKECPTPKFGSRRNSSKTRHCTSLPIFHNASELCEIGSRPGMECMPLRTPPGPYHHYHHVTDQTKSLQELQNEVGALLEFRDLVIETFPDLKHKMASMSATNTLTGMASSSSLASRREWEPGIRVKRKITPKENSELVSSSLIRSRSNSHSGKKEPKSGEGNGSVVQDSGFSTETSSSKEAHSASSTTGAMQGTVASNRLPQDADDDELLNLLDVIHRKSNRLRDEVEYLQNLRKDNNKFRNKNLSNSDNNSSTAATSNFLNKTFQDHLDKLNREDFQILRKERDRLIDKLAEKEAETLAGRIKATNLQDQVDELCNVKKELEEKLKLALSQKLELMHELQRQCNNNSNSNSSSVGINKNLLSSQSELPTSHRNLTALLASESSTTTTTQSHLQGVVSSQNYSRITPFGTTSTATTFQPVVVESSVTDDNNQQHQQQQQQQFKALYPFHSNSFNNNNINNNNNNNSTSDICSSQRQLISRDDILKNLGRLDGLISSPNRTAKVRMTDSKKIAAILLETNVLELQRHLLTLTVQNQILMQRLEQQTKSKIFLLKKLDKSKEELDDIKFQLEEKDIELEGTKAQLRVLESKTPLKLDFNTAIETNRSSSTMILSSSRDSPITTPTQISTPSMKAMIPLPMDEIQHHSSSTESAQDQTERTDSRYGSSSGCQQPETPKRSRPSKIPLPGTKGYLAPKPPTGRSPTTATSSILSSSVIHQKSPCGSSSSGYGPVSNKSLSRSTGNLYGKSGPPSVKRFNETSSSSLQRPESAQSNNTKDNSLTGGLNTSSRSSSSSIPISSKSTPSPHKMISNSPLPRPKRDSLTSRVRHLDSLSRVHNNFSNNSSSSSTTATPTTTNIKNTTGTPTTTNTSTPSSPSNNHNTSSSSSSNLNLNSSTNNLNNSNCTQLNNQASNNLLFRSSISSSSTSNSKKDLSSSFTQGQLRDRCNDRNNKFQQNSQSVRRVSSASIGRGSNIDLHHHQQQQQHQQPQQNENESGKINKIRKFESMDSLLIDDDYYLYRKYKESQQLQQQHQEQQQGYTSRNLINEYIAKTFNPPAIFKPSFLLPTSYYYDDSSCNKAQIELAYKHPQLLFDIETNEESIEIEVNHDNDDDDSDDEFIDERQPNQINYGDSNVDHDDDDDDENEDEKSINSFNTITTTTTNYQTNKGIEIKYFKHSQDDLMNLPPPPYPSDNRFLRRTVSATNFNIKNYQQQFQQLQPQQSSSPPPPPPPINPNHYFENIDEKSPTTCKLIGKVNPVIARTWEQLNIFQNNYNNNRYNLLSRSTSNMSDDSEKLFFCHPTVQESKSNFHVNKVIYCEEENSYDGKRTKQEEEEEDDDDDEDEEDNAREQRKEKEDDEEISGNFYDSIDDNNHYNYRHYHHQFVENNNNLRHQQQYHENIYSIEKQQQQQQQEGDAGEEMAEIDSIEKKNYFWSLESEFK